MEIKKFLKLFVEILKTTKIQQILSISSIEVTGEDTVKLTINDAESFDISISRSKNETKIEESEMSDIDICKDIKILENGLDTPIEYVYRHEKKLKVFMKNCIERKKYTMRDLKDSDFDNLKGINESVTIELKNIYLNFGDVCKWVDSIPVFVKEKLIEKYKKEKSICLNEELKELKIDQLLNLNIPRPVVNMYKKKDIKTFLDLSNMDYLLEDLEENNRNIIMNALSLSLKEYIYLVFECKVNDKNYEIMLQRANGYTFEEIAVQEGVKKQRIEQREKDFSRGIVELLDLFLGMFEKKTIQRKDIFNEFIDNHNMAKIICKCLHHSNKFLYLNFCEKFVIKDLVEDEKVLKNKLFQITDSIIGDGVNFVEAQDSIVESLSENGLDYIDVNDYLEFLIQQGYHKYGDYIAKKSTSYGLVVADAIKIYYPNGFKTKDEDEQNNLFKILDEKYQGLKYNKTCRPFATRVEEALVLCDRGTYTHKNHIIMDQTLIDKIYDYISNSSESSFYDQELFGKFEEELKEKSNVTNRYFLHGVLHEYYPDDFKYDKDAITRIGEKKIRIEEKIALYLKEKHCAVSMNTVSKDMGGIKESLVLQASLRNKQILMWGNDHIQHIENLIISEEEKESIYNILRTVCEKYHGYCSEELLFARIKEAIPGFIECNQINKRGMYFIARALFSSIYNFEHLPHIVKKNTEIKEVNFKEIFYMLMGNKKVFDYNEYLAKAREVGWSDPTIYMLLRDVRSDWIQISIHRYIKPSEFFIKEENLQEISYVISKVIRDQGYLSLYYQKDFYSELPDIGFEWNGFLINSIIEYYKMNFKVICPQNQSRDSAKIFILDSKTTIKTYDELIASEMKKNHIDRISEDKWRDYLHDKKLIVQIIPQELYCSDRFKIKDEMVILV